MTDLFKDGEPDADAFFAAYGRYIAPVEVELKPLTASMLREELLGMKASSPGLDAWSHEDLKLLAVGAPWVFDSLCALLQSFETHSRWPVNLISGFTAMIPKASGSVVNPSELRPITVLSQLYRLWARIRARQLNVSWQEQWAHDGVWGGRVGRGAEPLLIDVALDLETCGPGCVSAGLSFDLSKAFDRVPRELLGELRSRMRPPKIVHGPYMHMLRRATRRYKIGVNLDKLTSHRVCMVVCYRAAHCQWSV